MAARKITTPLTDEVVRGLRAGDEVEISGVVYQAHVAAAKSGVDSLTRTRKQPKLYPGQPRPKPPGSPPGSW